MKLLRAIPALLLPAAVAAAEVDFGTQIRPILSEHCTSCHGGAKKRGDLSLISESLAMARTESGKPAIVPGHPDKSELIARITHADPDERMPPEGDGLSPEEIALLKQWIRDGAGWDTHWSFQPIQTPTPPAQDHPVDSW